MARKPARASTQGFKKFHRDNPHIYEAFVRFALEAARRRTHYSARDIVHRVRWWMQIETKSDDDLKINNNWSPFYARLFAYQYPEHADLFQYRTSVADWFDPSTVGD